jgi:uncharacterized protein (DUF952 family)
MLIYKILTAEQWKVLDNEGETVGAPIDVADGYMHFSTASQVRMTVALYFAGQADLVLAAVDTETLGAALQWDKSISRGEEFPHLYAKLNRSSVTWFETLVLGPDGTHVLPAQLLEVQE